MTEAWKQWEGQLVNGEFHLRQYLGGSEHSAVFLTEHAAGKLQKAAIKFIPADPANAELQLSRWAQAAKLSHPHLIRLFQMGRCQVGDTNLLYVVMEYAEEDLSQVLPHRPLTSAEAREMLGPVLEALAYAHAKGFVHGHLKPANIMASADQLKLSSDGLLQMGEPTGRTLIEPPGGPLKPGLYAPPETAGGGSSPAGDVWSLGLTLVEALTQRLPAWERNASGVTSQGEPLLPQTVPAPFLDIARNCLRRDPRLRWTLAEIATRLESASPVSSSSVASSPAPVRPSPLRKIRTTPRPKRSVAKRRYMIPALAVGLALAAMLVGPKLLNRRPQAQPAPSLASKQTPVQQKVQPKLQPLPAQKPLAQETPQSTQPAVQKTGDEKPSSRGAASAPASSLAGLEHEAAAKTATGDRVPGEVLEQILPDVSQKAKDTIRGTVRVSVRVSVDAFGSVVGTTLDSPGPSQYFANLALRAARHWEFAPAKAAGRNVSSEWILRFDFTQTATKVFPVQTAP